MIRRSRLILAALLLAASALTLAPSAQAGTTTTTTPLYYALPTTSTLQVYVGSPVGIAFQVLGGGTRPVTYSITSGSLPAGLTYAKTMNNSSTMVTGTPTTVQSSTFTLKATDKSGNTVSKAFTIVVSAPLPVVFTAVDSALAAGAVGVAYSWSLYVSGGTAPYTFSLVSGALPTGLSLNSSGSIYGTPTKAGTYSFNAKVVDAKGQQATRTFSIAIS